VHLHDHAPRESGLTGEGVETQEREITRGSVPPERTGLAAFCSPRP